MLPKDGSLKGRYIKRGSKAITLCMPVTRKYNKPVKDSITGEEKEIKYIDFMFKNNWFALSQTDGKELEPEDININWNKEKALSEFDIKEINFGIVNGNTQGYATFDNEIAINPLAQLPVKTLFHEIAHVQVFFFCSGKRTCKFNE